VACAAVLGVGAAVAPAVAGAANNFRGSLHLLLSGKGAPFADASAKLTLVGHGDDSTAVLVVHGVDRAEADRTFGAHLHSGRCVDGVGSAAGPHYHHTRQPPPTISDQTEIWLDFTVDDEGNANAVAHVPFVPTPGQRSVVIHERATAANGTAGDRIACLPVEW
jgi:hypothetical protein